jgi:ribosomal protein S18 acetylase RimI-like enzyme
VNTISTIRQATPNDMARIKEIIDLSFPRFFRFFANHSVSDQEEPLLISELQGVVVGFAKLTEFQIGIGKYGCILWIAVHPANRRMGKALALTNASVDCLKSRGARAVFASTQQGNKAEQATLRKAGFEQAGFSRLMRLFGWQVFSFYRDIWYAPGEIVFMRS